MTKEKIEKFAKEEWNKIVDPLFQSEQIIRQYWEFFRKGIEISLSEYKWKDEDVYKMLMKFGLDYKPDKISIGEKAQMFIKKYELQQETGTTEVSPKAE